MILLDTNVLSELMRPSPSPVVMAWMGEHPVASFYTTTVTQAEILHGIQLLPSGKRRSALEDAANAVFDRDFAGRVVSFGSDAARAYARIASERSRIGRPISQFDAQIAAIASAVGAALATRNAKDFESCGIAVVNPWR